MPVRDWFTFYLFLFFFNQIQKKFKKHLWVLGDNDAFRAAISLMHDIVWISGARTIFSNLDTHVKENPLGKQLKRK